MEGKIQAGLPPLSLASLWIHICTSVIYIMRKCFCCPRLRYQRGKTEQKWLQGGRNAIKTTQNCPPGQLKEEQTSSQCLAPEEVKAALGQR